MRFVPLVSWLSVLAASAAGPLGCKADAPDKLKGEDFLGEPDPPRPGAGAAGPAKFEGAGVVMPRGADVPGWKLKQGPDYYDSSNLYEVINGAAAGYLAYGFKQMAKADYAPDGIPFTEEIVVEAYQMKSPLAAYGKWSEERSSCDPTDRDKPPGCSRGSDRILYQGQWFIKVTTYDDSPAAVAELHKLATAIAKRTPGDAKVPDDADRLPADNRKDHSVVYRPKGLLGIGSLGDGFQADYEKGEAQWSLFFKRLDKPPRTAELLARLRHDAAAPGFAKEGTKTEAVPGLGEEALAVQTTDGWMVAARLGDVVAGGVEFGSKDAAVAAARQMLTPAAAVPQ